MNTDTYLTHGLMSLGISSTMMQVLPDLKQKFRCFLIAEHNVKPIVDLIPDLQETLEPLTVPVQKRTFTWKTDIVLDKRLFPYQVEGVKWAIAHQGGFIADEPGLGKTIQALQWLENSPYTKALIVAPASVALNWGKECQEWSKSWTAYNLGTASNTRKVMKDESLKACTEKIAYIITWSQLANVGHTLMDFGFDVMIADEAHRAKSMQAKRTVNALAIAKIVDSVLLLSGTPMKNVPAELYPQMKMITDSFGTFEEFIERYSPPDELVSKTGTYKVFRRGKNLKELRKRVSNFMIFRKKADVLKDLPELIHRKLPIPLKNRILLEWEYIIESMESGELEPAQLIKHRQEVGIWKAKGIADWIEENSNKNNPIVVFFVHKAVHNILKKEMEKRELTYRSIVGSTPKKKREEAIVSFQNGEVQVMLCSEAAKEGITLTRASQLLMLERLWVPADEEQVEARVHRIGSKKPVIITHAHSALTIDDLIVSKLARKRTIIQKVFAENIMEEPLLNLFLNLVQL